MFLQHKSCLSFLSLICLCFFLLSGEVEATKGRNAKGSRHVQPEVRDTGSSYAIVGVPFNGSSRSIPQRLEIRRLQHSHPLQWNLYLLALHTLQTRNQSSMTSWYQIAGIHGVPFVEWDNVPLKNIVGYCTHNLVIFPTWHRPYVALYEQVMYGIVQDLAKNFSSDNRAKYVKAAKTFRVPYWDWAAPPPKGEHVMPDFLSSPTPIRVISPNGTITIPNPLYRYDFSPLVPSDMVWTPYTTWTHTLRSPTSNWTADATSQDSRVVSQIDANQPSFSKRLLNILQAYPSYDKMSTKAWMSNPDGAGAGSYDSLESLHDTIHTLIGNGGHFTWNEYSGFDPLFMLHHANVDRQLAIWQALYPTSWVQPTPALWPTATINVNDVLDDTSALTPFHKDTAGTFWTSASVRDPTVFGYTYDETAAGCNTTCTIRAANKLYSTSATQPLNQSLILGLNGTNITTDPTNPYARQKRSRQASSLLTHLSPRSGPQQPGVDFEWLANIRVAPSDLNTSFSVYVFLGAPTTVARDWHSDPNFEGAYGVLVSFSGQGANNGGKVVSGTVPLAKVLNERIAAGAITGDQSSVEAWIEGNITWRVGGADNTEIPREHVPSLRISVAYCPVTKGSSADALQDWGECVTLPNITENKVNGLARGEVV